jgi:hypothetical protein
VCYDRTTDKDVKYLVQAERHMADGEQHILRQRAFVAQLERDGRDASLSRNLLQCFEDLQRLHIADFHRLLEELADSAATDRNVGTG